ncbi:recombinase family protein [Lysinibacillus sphaericus]|uniref:recombinase family protein n=1 Tax=Lysinibacillus sphaericus TaxID=1421 RepID=UPI0018CCA0E4|nr:recombinase family protein [Lysinibacillus sphaericus]MBG9754287.1 hypothetical protein [Lysinibacillus sphaericus]QTB13121.1 recombinase family protein [Lysinibacillus sphaericus]
MKNKYKVFFRRVSSKGQDLVTQESADALYRQQYLVEEILIIEEHAVSANKLNISERPEMMKLVSMILNDQVDILYAFDRSRLFRDFYESNYLVNICKEKNVPIIFTSDGHQQASGNTLIEGVLNIVGDIEGKNIARRTDEARKRYPPRKFGYIKQKENGTKKYVQDPEKLDLLKKFFADLTNVSTHIELEGLLQIYKKALGTSPETLLKLAKDPFYAGYDLSTGKNRLDHVTPYLTLAQFEVLQEKKSILSKYEENIETLRNSNIYQPYCGICQKPMSFRFNILEAECWYTCSRKHPKVMVSFNDLSDIIIFSLENIIEKLDIDKLMKDSRHCFNSIKNPLESDLQLLKKNKSDILEDIIVKNDDIQNWREHPHYKMLIDLEQKVKDSLSKIEDTERLLLGNDKLVNLVKEYLKNGIRSNLYFLYSMLVQKLNVFKNEIYLEINRFDYLEDIQKTFTYEEGVLL